jgi:hypothetical protein
MILLGRQALARLLAFQGGNPQERLRHLRNFSRFAGNRREHCLFCGVKKRGFA